MPLLSAKAASMISFSWAASLSERGLSDELAERPSSRFVVFVASAVPVGSTVLSVSVALLIAHWPALHLEFAPVSLLLCAVMLSAWFGGVGPGVVATILSAAVFYYGFLPPVFFLVAKPAQIASDP